MIVYIDTSALVKLLTSEAGAAFVRKLWVAADVVVTSTLLYPEARSAVSRARRGQRLNDVAALRAARLLDRLVAAMRLAPPTRRVVWRAGELADAHVLRGFDAVHLSTAIEAGRAQTTLVSADRRLADAARDEGLRVVVPV